MIARDITRDCERFLACVGALLALACTTIAHAQPSPRSEPDDGPLARGESCDAARLVRERVEQQQAPGAWGALDVAIQLASDERGYRLTLNTERDGMQGTREFAAATCDEVVDAAALLLTLMLDEAREQDEAEARGYDDERPPLPAPPPPRARRAHATVKAAALGELGYLPRAGVGAEVALGVALRRARLELSGLWLPDMRSARGTDGGRVAIGLWAARLGYCQQLVGHKLALFGCLGLELGRAHGQGLGLTSERERTYLWSAGYAGLRVALSLGRGLALLVEPALAVPFARRRFVSTDAAGAPSDDLHTPAPVSGRLAIALQAAF